MKWSVHQVLPSAVTNGPLMGVPHTAQIGILVPGATWVFMTPRPRFGAGRVIPVLDPVGPGRPPGPAARGAAGAAGGAGAAARGPGGGGAHAGVLGAATGGVTGAATDLKLGKAEENGVGETALGMGERAEEGGGVARPVGDCLNTLGVYWMCWVAGAGR